MLCLVRQQDPEASIRDVSRSEVVTDTVGVRTLTNPVLAVVGRVVLHRVAENLRGRILLSTGGDTQFRSHDPWPTLLTRAGMEIENGRFHGKFRQVQVRGRLVSLGTPTHQRVRRV